MDIKIGSVVRALAGREKDRYFVAVDVHDGFVYIADGKERKLSAPKKKNIKHISPVKAFVNTDELTDKKLRQLTRSYLTQANCQKDQQP
ncbi:MAG: KOW domain-containing RNA-binding protein [Ruminococcus sp.]|nr:KOW domain-containing RNA-binding protein [Ruminococcus sp.]